MNTMKTIKLLLLAVSILFTANTSFANTSSKSLKGDSNIASAKDGVVTVYSDGKEGIKEVYSQIKTLSPKAGSILTKMATKLEVGADRVWDILVRQQLVWSICFLILTISSLFNWYQFYRKYISIPISSNPVLGRRSVVKLIANPEFDIDYYNKYNRYEKSSYSSERDFTQVKCYNKYIQVTQDEDYILSPADSSLPLFKYLHLIICIALSALSIYHFSAMMTGFINPEFGAMKTILEYATTLK